MYRPYMGNCFLFVLHGITIDSLEQPFPLKLVGKLCVQEKKKLFLHHVIISMV